jgi:hypothetical protein
VGADRLLLSSRPASPLWPLGVGFYAGHIHGPDGPLSPSKPLCLYQPLSDQVQDVTAGATDDLGSIRYADRFVSCFVHLVKSNQNEKPRQAESGKILKVFFRRLAWPRRFAPPGLRAGRSGGANLQLAAN